MHWTRMNRLQVGPAWAAVDRRLLAGLGGALLVTLLTLAFSGSGDEPELPPPPPAPTMAIRPLPTLAPPLPVSAVPVASVDGLILYGIGGGGPRGRAALLGTAGGGQRMVPAGKEYRPGLRVRQVGADYVLLASAAGDTRLELNRYGPPVEARAGPTRTLAAAPPAAPTGSAEVLKLRLGLAPRKSGGRITGFTLRRGADLPLLQRAGLRAGDVLVAVNGQAFESEEKVLELPKEIAGSYTAEFEYERGGKRMKSKLEVNPRPQ